MEQCRRVRDPPDHEKIRTIASRVRINCFSCPCLFMVLRVRDPPRRPQQPPPISAEEILAAGAGRRRQQNPGDSPLPPPPAAARSRNESLRLVSGFCSERRSGRPLRGLQGPGGRLGTRAKDPKGPPALQTRNPQVFGGLSRLRLSLSRKGPGGRRGASLPRMDRSGGGRSRPHPLIVAVPQGPAP